MPYFRKWKLQPNKVPTPAEQWACTKQVLFSHFTIELPAVCFLCHRTRLYTNITCCMQIWLFHPTAEALGMQTYQVPFPSLKTMAPQIFLFFFFEDFFHFVGEYAGHVIDIFFKAFLFLAHQALHTGVLYKHIHKIHHKYSAPFGLAAEYAHPAEVFILGAGTILGPLMYCYFTQNLHIATVYLWIVLRLFQAIDAHSGYGKSSLYSKYKSILTATFRLPMVTSQHRPFLVRR